MNISATYKTIENTEFAELIYLDSKGIFIKECIFGSLNLHITLLPSQLTTHILQKEKIITKSNLLLHFTMITAVLHSSKTNKQTKTKVQKSLKKIKHSITLILAI